MKIRYRLQSKNDLNEIFDFLYQRNPKIARETMLAIDNAVNLILRTPLLFPLAGLRNLRVKLISHYPYKIFYVIDEDVIVIHRIYHTARNNNI